MSKLYGTPGPRVLSPDACTSHRLAQCPIGAQLLWDRLLTQADDQGRLHGDPSAIKGLCMPFVLGVTPLCVSKWLDRLAKHGLILWYSKEETRLIQMERWWEYQAGMRRAYPSRWPAPDGWNDRVYGLKADQRPGMAAECGKSARTLPANRGASAGTVPAQLPPMPMPVPMSDAVGSDSLAEARSSAVVAESDKSVSNPSPPKRERKKPSGDHAAFIDWWCAAFLESRGHAYAFQDAKDGSAVKAILKAAGTVVEAQRVAKLLLDSDDPFYAKGVDLCLLRSQWNKLRSAKAVNGQAGRPANVGRAEPSDMSALKEARRVIL